MITVFRVRLQFLDYDYGLGLGSTNNIFVLHSMILGLETDNSDIIDNY